MLIDGSRKYNIYVTFDSDFGLEEQLIISEGIHFGIGSANENVQLFIVKPNFHRGTYIDQLFYRAGHCRKSYCDIRAETNPLVYVGEGCLSMV